MIRNLRYLARFVSVSILFVCCGTVRSELTDRQIKVRHYLDSVIEVTGGASLSAAIGVGDEVVDAYSTGNADDVQDIQATTLHRYRTGSISKSITAVAIFKLIESGKVSLDDDIRTYVPAYPRKEWPITIAHLLTHTSGIRHYMGSNPRDRRRDETHFETLEESLTLFKDDSLLFEPGTDWHYSSYGFNLLQGVVEHAIGRGFEEALMELVFTPARMNHSSLEIRGRPDSMMARGYEIRSAGLKEVSPIETSYKYAAGGMLSTPTDLVRFMISVHKHRLLDSVTTALMLSEPFEEIKDLQAYGWYIGRRTSDDKRIVFHGGTIRGFVSYIIYFPDHDVYVAVQGNWGDFRDIRFEVANRLADIFLN